MKTTQVKCIRILSSFFYKNTYFYMTIILFFFSFLCQFLMMKNTNTVKLNNDWDKILKTELESNGLQATLNQIEKEKKFSKIFFHRKKMFLKL